MASQNRGMGQGDTRSMLEIERPHLREQTIVGADIVFEMGYGDEDERLGVRDEIVPATVGPVELTEEPCQPVEVGVRASLIPRAKRKKSERVEEVIVEEDGENGLPRLLGLGHVEKE